MRVAHIVAPTHFFEAVTELRRIVRVHVLGSVIWAAEFVECLLDVLGGSRLGREGSSPFGEFVHDDYSILVVCCRLLTFVHDFVVSGESIQPVL